VKQGRRDKAKPLDAWLRTTCKIDDTKQRMEILDLFVDPRFQP